MLNEYKREQALRRDELINSPCIQARTKRVSRTRSFLSSLWCPRLLHSRDLVPLASCCRSDVVAFFLSEVTINVSHAYHYAITARTADRHASTSCIACIATLRTHRVMHDCNVGEITLRLHFSFHFFLLEKRKPGAPPSSSSARRDSSNNNSDRKETLRSDRKSLPHC